AQVPGSIANPEFLQVAEPGGDFKTNGLQAEGAVAATLDAPDFSGEGQVQLVGGRTGLGDILVIKKTGQRSLAGLGMNLAVVFQLDPSLGRLVELLQRQIGDAFEHG